jgi:hypothetical protein
MRFAHWFYRATPLHLIILIVVMSVATNRLPPAWAAFVRLANGFTIVSFLIWGFVRFGQESRLYRTELSQHRADILEMMRARDRDLQALRHAATTLAVETAAIAKTLAEDTKASADTTHQKLNGLADQVAKGTAHARSAYEVANSVNEKISEQQEAILAQQKAAKHIDEMMEQLLERFDTVGERQREIQTVVVDTGEIIRHELLERADQTTRVQIDAIQHAAEDIQQQVGKKDTTK